MKNKTRKLYVNKTDCSQIMIKRNDEFFFFHSFCFFSLFLLFFVLSGSWAVDSLNGALLDMNICELIVYVGHFIWVFGELFVCNALCGYINCLFTWKTREIFIIFNNNKYVRKYLFKYCGFWSSYSRILLVYD